MSAASSAAQATGNPGVNNTAWLFFVLAMAFLFFVTVRGDLPKWLGLLGLGGSPASKAAATPAMGTPAVIGGLPGLPALPTLGAQGSSTGGTVY